MKIRSWRKLILINCFRRADLHNRRTEMRIGIVDLPGADRHAPQSLNGGAGIIEGACLTRGLMCRIKPAPNRHVAPAEKQSVFTVGDTICADVEPVASRDDRRDPVFNIVGHRASPYRNMVAVN